MSDETPVKKKASAPAKKKKAAVAKKEDFEVLSNPQFKALDDAMKGFSPKYAGLKNLRFIIKSYQHYLSNLKEEYKHKAKRGEFDEE